MKLILTLFALLIINHTLAQNPEQTEPYNITLGYSRLSFGSDEHTTIRLRLESSYRVYKPLSVGAYFGYGAKYFRYGIPNTLLYGINVGFHPLALLLEDKNPRFDLYGKIKYGGYSFVGNTFYPKGYITDYGISVAIQYYPWAHTGVFIEYAILDKLNKSNAFKTNVMFGIAVNF